MDSRYTLDSFALLSWFQDERGAKKVDSLIKKAENASIKLWLSIINLGEVYYIIYRERGVVQAEHSLSVVENLPIEIVSADKKLTLRAAEIKANYSLSYADAFSAALGIQTDSLVVTGDPEFNSLLKLVGIEWLDR
ncbi:type II toxin-antitoxin system VapC family toxin [Candidatus Margulisiibacteriota bacterium]